jgi:hypothetical protein
MPFQEQPIPLNNDLKQLEWKALRRLAAGRHIDDASLAV